MEQEGRARPGVALPAPALPGRPRQALQGCGQQLLEALISKRIKAGLALLGRALLGAGKAAGAGVRVAQRAKPARAEESTAASESQRLNGAACTLTALLCSAARAVQVESSALLTCTADPVQSHINCNTDASA